ncbi:hypothetical protein KsCSTR_07360 [Candidatus Kuenenia stuttgartiensis]|jgi:hypothetical protein|uniref:Uncharacterized protein n=1 Tax=Kuenenia stuttgartiensis TaxID=174633 RepID=Q1PZJ1_KUEST|nr:hypothetical protein KsCSTR_07360 [Candidatus Kuenenia stuttgartiensis]TVM02418.1 MAG: hypothetical protein CV080_00820 [Candidatus Kuenenia stuttgartiensis]GJQ48872.1 MAG: hypothetical protein HKUEN01_12580 [Candidatus Kuenenia stuttgartiensis]CAJ72507.1 unknown protein [Candidatus Kuenenia stuttgartiensis]
MENSLGPEPCVRYFALRIGDNAAKCFNEKRKGFDDSDGGKNNPAKTAFPLKISAKYSQHS